jgi:predicted O-methyltransferase YrrM
VAARHAVDAVGEHGAIVEIGSALGGSTLLMASATARNDMTGPPIMSIDPDASTRGAMRAALAVEGHESRLRQIVKRSDEAARDVADMRGTCAMVFIDGLHTREAASGDVRDYAGLVAPGGVLAMHDCSARYDGVWRAASAVVANDARFETVCLADTLLIVRRRS